MTTDRTTYMLAVAAIACAGIGYLYYAEVVEEARIKAAKTKFMKAVIDGEGEVVSRLLQEGADANIACTTNNGALYATPLFRAAENGHGNIVAKLLDHSFMSPHYVQFCIQALLKESWWVWN